MSVCEEAAYYLLSGNARKNYGENIMLDLDMFPDMGDGLFPLPERKGCSSCGDNGNGDNGNTDNDNGNVVYPDNRMVLAMGYVPSQEFDELYNDYSVALDNGSLFRSLTKPFYGGKGER